MYTKNDLQAQLRDMGILHTDAVMLHSSMKAIGEVEGGADTVIDAFMEHLGEGLFMTPAHTWAQMGESHSYFDPETEPACVGIIPNLFLRGPAVVRDPASHPQHRCVRAFRGGIRPGRGKLCHALCAGRVLGQAAAGGSKDSAGGCHPRPQHVYPQRGGGAAGAGALHGRACGVSCQDA